MFFNYKSRLEESTSEAKKLLETTEKEIAEAKAQDPIITLIVKQLIARRNENHFAEELTVTFNPRSNNA